MENRKRPRYDEPSPHQGRKKVKKVWRKKNFSNH